MHVHVGLQARSIANCNYRALFATLEEGNRFAARSGLEGALYEVPQCFGGESGLDGCQKEEKPGFRCCKASFIFQFDSVGLVIVQKLIRLL
jgi:hypothetical protein